MATNDILFPLEVVPPEPYEIVPGSAHFRHNSFETTISYDRSNGHNVGLTLCHPLPQSPLDTPSFVIGVYATEDNPNCDAIETVTLSIPELRLLRDLLLRHEVAAYLGEEE